MATFFFPVSVSQPTNQPIQALPKSTSCDIKSRIFAVSINLTKLNFYVLLPLSHTSNIYFHTYFLDLIYCISIARSQHGLSVFLSLLETVIGIFIRLEIQFLESPETVQKAHEYSVPL